MKYSEDKRSDFINNSSLILVAYAYIFASIIWLITKQSDNYSLILNIIITSLAISCTIIVFTNNKLIQCEFYCLLGKCLLVVGICTGIVLVMRKAKSFSYLHYEFIIENLIFLLEDVGLLCSITLINNKNRLIKSVMVLLASIIILIICSNSKYLLGILYAFIAIINILEINKKKEQEICEEKKNILFFIFLLGIYQEMYIYNFNLVYISTVRFIAYLVIIRCIERQVLEKSYKMVKKNMEATQTMQMDLNSVLKSRNRNLKELTYLIEKSEKNFSNLISAISDGVVVTNENNVIYSNDVAEEILDDDTDSCLIGESIEMLLRKLLIKGLVDEKFFCQVIPNYNNNMNNNMKEEKLYRIKRIEYNGSFYDIYLVKMNKNNHLIYLKDITELKKSKELRLKYLEYMKEEETKNKFYSNISHELRTPINVIYSALQVNEMHLKNKDLQFMKKNNDTIKQNCLRLIRTINNFIDTNKITEGFLKANKKVYNIVSIVENISMACNVYINKSGNNLVFDSVEEEIYSLVDKEMLERVMLNLLSNMVKHGKGCADILVNISLDGDVISVDVQNKTYSIDEDIMPYIFDKFTMINKSYNREKEGSGLGLFLCKALMELQGGAIEVSSTKEEGTVFTLKLLRHEYVGEPQEIEYEMNSIAEKVDIEFSDIYI